MDCSGKRCVITGGANGIGRCMVQTFLAAGAATAFIDTDRVAGEALTAAHREFPPFFYHGNLARKADLHGFAEEVKQRFETVDFLVHNACFSRRGILSGCGYEDFSEVLAVGVTAPYYLTSLLRDILAPGASVVMIASTRAAMSQADTESYSAAKGGISALTHALAASLAGKARVNAISPGWIDTSAPARMARPEHSQADMAQHPAGRVGSPEDIAAMAMFLCSADASFITGQNMVVDGGMSTLMIYNDDHGWHFRP